jgi:alkylated DNA repair dioxygenase AlkB
MNIASGSWSIDLSPFHMDGQCGPPSLRWRMDLFGHDPSANLLPCDGVVNYLGAALSASEASTFYQTLLDEVPWSHDEVVMFGRRVVTAREVAWFGDVGLAYRYSGTTKQPLPWTPELTRLKTYAEKLSKSRFNSCLLNLYHDGGEGMGWHSDDEKSIVRDSAIAAISLGAEREFRLKHKGTGEKVSIVLESGSLLVMKGATQRHWLHSVPKSKKVVSPRINLTFRTMIAPP